VFGGQAEDDLGVSHGEAAVAEVVLECGAEFEQPERVGNHGAAFADFEGDLLLCELELLDQLRVTLGFLHRVEVLALQILDQGQLEHGAVVGFPHDDGHLGQAQKLGCAPAALTRDEFEMAVAFADDQGLNDALLADGISELAQRFRRKVLSRLQRAGADAVERNTFYAVAGIDRRVRRRGRDCHGDGRFRWGFADGRRTAQQGGQAAAQSWFCHAARVSQGRRDVNVKRHVTRPECLHLSAVASYDGSMTHKSLGISKLIEPFRGRELDAHYLAYFECFNRGHFFEAHEVLEELWLAQKGGSNYAFHKGLIQLAGAFVHLQKGRPRPATSLFKLAGTNLKSYPAIHEKLNVTGVLKLIGEWERRLEEAGFKTNPLDAARAPKLSLEDGGDTKKPA